MTDNTTQYQLKDGVLFVQGARCGAIIDTNTGGIYSVNDVSVTELKSENTSDKFWQTMATMGLAEPRINEAVYPLLPKADQSRLEFIWFEITSKDCNERCIHCYADSMPPSYRHTEIF